MAKPEIPVTLSTSSIFSLAPQHVFAMAEDLGYDGVEIMVTQNRWTHNPTKLNELSYRHSMPIHAVHAPTLLFTQQVWGSAWNKVARAADLARELGAEIVVVHPPFRWQGSYAFEFATGIRDIMEATGVTIAVENMYPWRVSGSEIKMYLPHHDPIPQAYDYVTWDFSHAATAKMDSLAAIKLLGSRLAHVHLTDGSGRGTADEHLLPGYGHQRVVESLHHIAASDYDGAVCVEVSTRGQKYPGHREEMLAESLAFARKHLARTPTTQGED
ncbi:MAG: sugar phosphate isomerase/epimerase [Yaniella sp.]|nr:sugar phosphate isomerase/epimerase [Yaniella sp.]